MVVFSKSLDM